MKVGGYRICNTHGPHSEPCCQLCQADLNIRMAAIADSIAEQAHEKEQERAMTQPTEQQLNDPTWWDANAPEGATNWDTESEFFFDESGYWSEGHYRISHNLPRDLPRFIPRPTKPGPKEWDGEGLPPVGSDQTVFVPTTAVSALGARDERSRWVMVAHFNGMGVVCKNELGREKTEVRLVNPKYCRPPRTKEQRDRDELIDEAWSAIKQDYSSESKELTHPQEYVLNAICQLYDAGMLRRGGE